MKKIIFFMALMAALLCGCSQSRTVMSVETVNATEKAMTYQLFDGVREYTFKVKKDEPVTVAVEFTTEDGSLDAYIAKDNQKSNAVYQGSGVPTSRFTVTISEAGTYTIHLEADHHRGSYSFSW